MVTNYLSNLKSILHRDLVNRMTNQLFKTLVKNGKEVLSFRIKETDENYMAVLKIPKNQLLNKDKKAVERILNYYVHKLDEATFDEEG